MKTITRSEKEVVRFPQIGITLSLLEIHGSAVQIGVDAPSEILLAEIGQTAEESVMQGWLPRDIRHDLRNELHAIRVGMDLVREEIAAGRSDEARETLSEINDALERVDKHPVLNPGGTS